MFQVPVLKRSIVYINYSVLYQGVGTHQLVRRSVVDDVSDFSFSANALGRPIEVTDLESEGPELVVAAADADPPDLDVLVVLDQLRVGDGAALLEGSLFLVDRHTAAGRSPLMSGVSGNTHVSFEDLEVF